MTFDIKILIWIITVVLTIIGYIPYIRDIFRGKTKPHLYSWLVWGIFGFVVWNVQVANGWGPGSWMTLLLWIVCSFIAIISLKYGTKNITRADNMFLGWAMIALLSWIFVENVTISLILICTIDVLGFLPTIRKCWRYPNEETLFLYMTAAIRYGLSTIALATYTINTMLYPLLWFFINTFFCIYVIMRRNIVTK